MEEKVANVQNGAYITRLRLNPAPADEKRHRKDSIRKISSILRKEASLRTAEEKFFIEKFPDVTNQINKRKERIQLYKERLFETEDSQQVIEEKAEKLAEIISRAQHLVCYTGAGISTSARIPDYRGSNGIWTLLQKGKEIQQYDLSLADPTFTHMALYELYQRKMLRHVVSQNCDGLHLRSGLPKTSISEIHGNMYIEVCKNCKPNAEYWRLFDTTENTARYYHKTKRRCHNCGKGLSDTIVHFGERGNLKWPLNWSGACHHSEKADVILCLGSSLKVLKKYHWLWQTDLPSKKRAKICVVNLQWTPKDKISTIKINGKCDEVMRLVMKHLNIKVQSYTKKLDPIFAHSSILLPEEFHTVSQPMLKTHLENEKDDKNGLETVSCVLGKGPLIRTPLKNRTCLKTNLEVKKLLIANGSEKNIASDTDLLETKLDLEPHLGWCDKQAYAVVKEEQDIDTSIDIKIKTEPIEQDNLNGSVDTSKELVLFANNSPKIKDHYSNFIDYITVMKDKLPNWYDVRYAYSGLHSIVQPPPPEINFWSSQIIPVFRMNRKEAECEFCFDAYAEMACQFYKKFPIETAFKKITESADNTTTTICECCTSNNSGDDPDVDQSTEMENNSDSESTASKSQKRSRFEVANNSTANAKKPVTVQAGWYGKGYKKVYKKKGKRK